MPLRFAQVLGALLAVAALAALPAGAASGGSPTANGSNYCDDNGPWSNWGDGWYGHDGDGRYWRGWGDGNGYFDGHAYYGHCDRYDSSAVRSAHGRVDHVMVAVKRLRDSGCQHLRRSGHLTGIRPCGTTHWMRADGTRNWRLDIARRLPAGRYRLHRRAVDNHGNSERNGRLHLRIP
jgi:hypothetical protein